jgi:hypothetical protein
MPDPSTEPSTPVTPTATPAAAATPTLTPPPPPPPLTPPTPTPTGNGAVQGAFEIQDLPDEEFDLRPAPHHRHPIPADQVMLSQDVYETKNILKLLQENNWFGESPQQGGAYREFINRVKEAAKVGCIGDDVETELATKAISQIRADILRRVGRRLAFRYLGFLAAWASGGAVIGLLVAAWGYAEPLFQKLGHYGWVIVGAMAGAWFGVAVRRWGIVFAELPDFLNVKSEPFVRMLFVAVVASILALFLDLGVLTIKLGEVNLGEFAGRVQIALLLGFIAGMSERAVSKQLMDQVGKVIPQS